MPDSASIVSKVLNSLPSPAGLRWPDAHVLKNAGVGYGDYAEQITYLLFGSRLQLPGFAQPCGLPPAQKAIGQLLELPMPASLPFSMVAPPSLKLRRAGDEMTELSRKSCTTAIDHLEAELDRQITRSNRLRQSTLAVAFRGDF